MNKFLKEECAWQSPYDVAKILIKEYGESGLIWLDGDKSNLGRQATLAVNPIQEITCRNHSNQGQNSNPFELLRKLDPGHWTGWISYEAGAWIEPKNSWKIDSMATLWIASHDPILKFDLKEKKLWIEGFKKIEIENIKHLIENISPQEATTSQANTVYKDFIPLDCWKWLTSEEEYIKNVNLIKDLISQGDIFQANLSACCTAKLPPKATPSNIFYRLKQKLPAPFAGLVVGKGSAEGEAIISSSPERFLKVLPNGSVESRPIKGTRPRMRDNYQDYKMAADLVCSPKDRAENIMIVDILRNDLGRVCETGSIHVPQLAGLESYPKVHHLTSIIKGDLKDSKTWVDLLEASWPGGSITGAPKLRACQRLHEMEPIARGPYCGSLININWDRTFDSSILIRSLMIKKSVIKAYAGCGIVADSEASLEAEELKWKLMPMLEALK